MKNSFLIFLFLGIFQTAHAQIEVSTNPVLILFEVIPLTIQKPINRDFEVGVDLLFSPAFDGGIFYGKGKYYFNPRMGADRFHIGAFVGGFSESVGGGFFAGYKILSERGVFLDLGLGLGRGTESVLPYGQLHVGYRFGRKEL